jgi:hypothetical protein
VNVNPELARNDTSRPLMDATRASTETADAGRAATSDRAA